MDIIKVSEELDTVRIMVARWAEKYNINKLEHSLVMDILLAVEKELAPMSDAASPEAGEGVYRDTTGLAAGGIDAVPDIAASCETDTMPDAVAGCEADTISDISADCEAVPDYKIADIAARCEPEPDYASADIAVSGSGSATESEDDIPTLSAIEREIIMHEIGSVPLETFGIGNIETREGKSLKSLYYDTEEGVSPHSDFGSAEPDTSLREDGTAACSTAKNLLSDTGKRNTADPYRKPLPGSTELKKALGDILNPDLKTIADTYSVSKTVADRYKSLENMAAVSMAGGESLRKSIGLNDKYLLVRDLFGGDTALYDKTVTELDLFDNLEDAMLYIYDNFNWDATSEGSKLLVELLVNKLK